VSPVENGEGVTAARYTASPAGASSGLARERLALRLPEQGEEGSKMNPQGPREPGHGTLHRAGRTIDSEWRKELCNWE